MSIREAKTAISKVLQELHSQGIQINCMDVKWIKNEYAEWTEDGVKMPPPECEIELGATL